MNISDETLEKFMVAGIEAIVNNEPADRAMPLSFTEGEVRELITAMDYAVKSCDECTQYPSYEFKLETRKSLTDLRTKLRQLRDELKKE